MSRLEKLLYGLAASFIMAALAANRWEGRQRQATPWRNDLYGGSR
jgi:hypothetical protein